MSGTGNRKGIGSFRRSYAARLFKTEFSDKRINPLHLVISPDDAPFIKKSTDDDTFVCAVHIRRENDVHLNAYSPIASPASSNTSSSLSSSAASTPHKPVLTNYVVSEEIVVCVWVVSESHSPSHSFVSDLDRSISIDGDTSSDEEPENVHFLRLRCTHTFLSHYSLSVVDCLFIRAINVYPLHKAIFSISDEEFYNWLQLGKFSAGLLKEICNHDFLVRQNDVLLAPIPEIFTQDENFHQSWYFHIKAIACTPLQMGLITAETEIIIYFEKAISRLPSDHRHLSGSHLDQYLALQTSLLGISDFCRSMSYDSNDGAFKQSEPDTENTFFLASAFVIQQKIHFRKVLHHDDNFERLDLTTVLGMPKKIMRQYKIMNGTILKVALFPGDNFGNPTMTDAKDFLRNEKPKQKFMKVQCLSSRLDESDVVFMSSMLLFNLQNGPPLMKSPLLIIEKPHVGRVDSETDLDMKPKLSRSVSAVVPFAIDVEISIISSPNYTPSADHIESLNMHFQIPRLLSVGDVFAVSSADDPDFWQDSNLDKGVRKPVIFFKVKSMSPRQPDIFAYFVDVNNSSLKRTGSDHSYVPLSASKYLSQCDAVYGQSIACVGLDRYVVMLESALLPHLNQNSDRVALMDLTPSVLLTGPRGCGKNTIVYTVARRLYMHVMEVNCHDLSGETASASESRIKTLFLTASKYSPCIILMSNIEVIGKERDGTTDDQRTISAFGRCVRQMTTQSQLYPLVVIATTHNPDNLSIDMIPSFLHEINVEAPSEMDRSSILTGLLENHTVFPDISISHLAQRTAGFVLGDLIALTLLAKRNLYQKMLKICRPDGGVVSLQEEEDIVTAGAVLEQCDLDLALDAMQNAHSDSIGAPKIPSVRWCDIGGLADVKSDILDTIQLPLQHPELLAAGLRRSGVLLYGPPGTGKTLLAKAVATECSLNFLSVKGPELINMYVGQSEENVREVFKRARSASPCVIFFDELDSLAPNRGRSGDSGGVMDRVVSQLLAELDGLHKSYDVFIIGATNRPDLLDPALLRPGRFDKLLYLGISEDKESQLHILKALTRKFKLSPDLELEKITEKCPPNLTGADLYALCADAMLSALRRKIMRLEEEVNEDETKLEVEFEDFEEALSTLIPSVSKEELEKYKQIRKNFES